MGASTLEKQVIDDSVLPTLELSEDAVAGIADDNEDVTTHNDTTYVEAEQPVEVTPILRAELKPVPPQARLEIALRGLVQTYEKRHDDSELRARELARFVADIQRANFDGAEIYPRSLTNVIRTAIDARASLFTPSQPAYKAQPAFLRAVSDLVRSA